MKRKNIFQELFELIENWARRWIRRKRMSAPSRDLQLESDEYAAQTAGRLVETGERIGRSSGNMKLRYAQAKTQAAAQLQGLQKVEARVPEAERMNNPEYRTALAMYAAAKKLEGEAFKALEQAEGMQSALRFQARVFDAHRQEGELRRELSVSKEEFNSSRAQMYKDMMAAMGIMSQGAAVDWTPELEKRAAEAEGGADMLEVMYGDLAEARGQQLEQATNTPLSVDEMDALHAIYGDQIPAWATKTDDAEQSQEAS